MKTSRRRPWRWALLIALVVVAGVLLLGGREVMLAVTAKPGNAVDYFEKWAELVERHQSVTAESGAPNAWTDLLAAARLAADVPETLAEAGSTARLDYTALWDTSPRNTNDEQATRAEMREWAERGVRLAAEMGVNEALARMAASPRAVRALKDPGTGRLMDVQLPELGEARNLARLCGARMFLAHRDGDDAEFGAAFEQCLALGRVVAYQGTLIDYLVGVAIHALAVERARAAVAERASGGEVLAGMLAAMDRQALPPFTLTLEGETLALHNLLQWSHTDDGNGDGRLILTEVKDFLRNDQLPGVAGTGPMRGVLSWRIANVSSLYFAGKAESAREGEAYLAGYAALAAKPRWERGDGAAVLERAIQGLSSRFALLKVIVPSTGQALRSADMAALQAAGTRVMLAVEVFQAREGRYPDSLGELAPGVLTEVPVDPWTGKSFVYKRVEPGADAYGRSYILYAVGEDGGDDGGLEQKEGNHLVLGPRGYGFDYVFNLQPASEEPEAPAADDPTGEEP